MTVLHFTRTVPALIPRYVSRFSCIGPACEDNCCTGWRVSIDKKTFNAYRQSQHPQLRQGFSEHLARSRSQESQANYGRIKLQDGTGECPFMEDRLCSVQKHLNESHLSNTCFSYPRVSRSLGTSHEQALLLSCPEAARQALLAPDAFEFVEGSITVRAETVSATKARSGLSLETINDIRIFCLNLVRVQDMPLWQRLAILGMFCKSLSEALRDYQQSTVPSLLDSYATLVEQNLAQESLEQLLPNHAAQARVFSCLWSGEAPSLQSAVQKAVHDAVARGLGADPETGVVKTEDMIAHYTRGIERLPEALSAAPLLLEHYVLNEMFLQLFPFEGKDPFENYVLLISRFGVLRLMLAAQCNTEKDLPNAEQLVQTVHVFCRRFQHDAAFAKQTNESLRATGLNSLASLYAFLRN